MAGVIQGSVQVQVSAVIKNADELSVSEDVLNFLAKFDLVHGSSAGQVNKLWHDRRTLTTGATEDLDLSGSLENRIGEAQVFTTIRGLIIKAADANTTNLELSRKATTGAHFLVADGDAISIKPGGMVCILDLKGTGYTVTDTTDDHITMTNASGASASYDIIVLGAG